MKRDYERIPAIIEKLKDAQRLYEAAQDFGDTLRGQRLAVAQRARIAAAREAQRFGISQAEIAEVFGVSRQRVQQLLATPDEGMSDKLFVVLEVRTNAEGKAEMHVDVAPSWLEIDFDFVVDNEKDAHILEELSAALAKTYVMMRASETDRDVPNGLPASA